MSVDHSALMWYGWYVKPDKLEEMYKHTKEYQTRLEDGEDEEWLMDEYNSWIFDSQEENIKSLNEYCDYHYAYAAVGVFFDPGNKTVFEFTEELTRRFGELTEWWGETFLPDYPMPCDFKLHMDVRTW
uniref:Uncharacterized protein n=1 Tax=Siphoviridae sp. ctZHD14 TaxID=2827891 RepID=A0A8S5SWP0_9CAUD|nr:MAG TPA: hypothetical protein [Siphoviridae sp. ctZHD14]